MIGTIDLVLTHHWFDEIANGDKREEYRANNEYYRRRLTTLRTPMLFSYRYGYEPVPYKPFKYVRFHRGYTSNTMTWTIESIVFGYGKKEWGAPDEPVHIIRVGRMVDCHIEAGTTTKRDGKKAN